MFFFVFLSRDHHYCLKLYWNTRSILAFQREWPFFVPYTHENILSQLAILEVVLVNQKTLRNSSTYFPFAPSNCFHKILISVLFEDSAWKLAIILYKVKGDSLMTNSWQKETRPRHMNYHSLSITSLQGKENLYIMLHQINFWTLVPCILANGFALINLEK